MRRILFVSGVYYPAASANGVCVMHIQKSLYELGVCSDVICRGEKNGLAGTTPYGDIYTIDHESKKTSNKFLIFINSIINWPIYYPNDIKSYRSALKAMLEKNSYSAVISVINPLEGALACCSLSNVILYELDSITNSSECTRGWRKFLKYRASIHERRIYDNARYIFHLECHRKYYSKPRYEIYKDKQEFTDIPHIFDEGYTFAENSGGKVNIAYTGVLLKYIREPYYAIELIKKLSANIDIECSFYSGGHFEDVISAAQNETNGIIKKCGYVSQDILKGRLENTDVFLSIGNDLSGEVTSVPSKVFTYMATGKPIIHIKGSDNDTAVSYLQKYGNAVIIDPKENTDVNTGKILAFLRSNLGKILSIEYIRELFPKNTPEYTAGSIFELISKWEQNNSED